MRSTLVKAHKRSCPQCGHLGFASTGRDYLNRYGFQCNACFHEWSAERGPEKGTSRHRPTPPNPVSENVE